MVETTEQDSGFIEPGSLGSGYTGEIEQQFSQDIASIIYEWEAEDKNSRGTLDETVQDAVLTWWGGIAPKSQ